VCLAAVAGFYAVTLIGDRRRIVFWKNLSFPFIGYGFCSGFVQNASQLPKHSFEQMPCL